MSDLRGLQKTPLRTATLSQLADSGDFKTALEALSSVGRESLDLGRPYTLETIATSYAPFRVFKEHKAYYPAKIVRVLSQLAEEYDAAFSQLVERNVEAPTDYQYIQRPNGAQSPTQYRNQFFQIDMAGLPIAFLKEAHQYSEAALKELLRRRIFEVEDNVGLYNLHRNAFAVATQASAFRQAFDTRLEAIRAATGKLIAVLAVTESKYTDLLKSELAVDAQGLREKSLAALRDETGFDAFLGPQDFIELEAAGRASEYLYFVRASASSAEMRQPGVSALEDSLLKEKKYREIIRAHSITLNIDDPNPSEQYEPINDSKAALPLVNMGCRLDAPEELRSEVFRAYCEACNVTGDTKLRAKPIYGSYGSYGALVKTLEAFQQPDSKIIKAMQLRGPYLLQREIEPAKVLNSADKVEYGYIDKLYFTISDTGSYDFMSGLRYYMPSSTREAKKNNYHGTAETVYGEILEASE